MRHQNDIGSHKPLSLVRVTSVVIICLAVLLSVAAILYGEGGSMFSSSSEDVVQVMAPVGKLSEPVRLTGRNQCIVWHALDPSLQNAFEVVIDSHTEKRLPANFSGRVDIRSYVRYQSTIGKAVTVVTSIKDPPCTLP